MNGTPFDPEPILYSEPYRQFDGLLNGRGASGRLRRFYRDHPHGPKLVEVEGEFPSLGWLPKFGEEMILETGPDLDMMLIVVITAACENREDGCWAIKFRADGTPE